MILRKFATIITMMMMLAAASLYATCAFAAQKANPKVDNQQNQAWTLLMNSADFLAHARQLSVNLGIRYDVVQKTGEKIEFNETRKITLGRPNDMRVDVEQGNGEKSILFFNGKNLTVYSPGQKMYATASRPGNVDQAIVYLLDGLHIRLPLAMMFVTKLPSQLKNRVRSVAIVGKDELMGIPCTQLAVRTNDGVDFQIWLPSKGDPLPRRLVITYKNNPGEPQFSANFSNWDLSPKLPKGYFAFTPPPNTQRIQFLAMAEAAKPKVGKGGMK